MRIASGGMIFVTESSDARKLLIDFPVVFIGYANLDFGIAVQNVELRQNYPVEGVYIDGML